jgi:hypothetical protein
MFRARTLLALLLLALCLGGCAVAKRANRRTLNALDAHATPASEPARWLLAPVAFPAGVLAVVADAFVVHPATVFDDAWYDTVDLLWTSREESRFRRALFLPLAALATPFVYAGDWLGRAALAIPPRDEQGDLGRGADDDPDDDPDDAFDTDSADAFEDDSEDGRGRDGDGDGDGDA